MVCVEIVLPRAVGADCDAAFVVVLHVVALGMVRLRGQKRVVEFGTYHRREVGDNGDIEVLQFPPEANAAELQNLGGVECSARHKDLAPSSYSSELTTLGCVVPPVS